MGSIISLLYAAFCKCPQLSNIITKLDLENKEWGATELQYPPKPSFEFTTSSTRLDRASTNMQKVVIICPLSAKTIIKVADYSFKLVFTKISLR